MKGQVAKVVQDSKPRILGEGEHLIESTDFEFKGFEDVVTTPFIVHGTITILRVVRGKVALAWQNNEPMFISEPGLYEFDSPDFSFDSFRLVPHTHTSIFLYVSQLAIPILFTLCMKGMLKNS